MIAAFSRGKFFPRFLPALSNHLYAICHHLFYSGFMAMVRAMPIGLQQFGLFVAFWIAGHGIAFVQDPAPMREQAVNKNLPIDGETFLVDSSIAFLIPAVKEFREPEKPWVWYAPTLPNLPGPEERWMFERFQGAGIAIAGIDAGESYGSPDGNRVFDGLHREMVRRGYSSTPVLLGRSRGGLQTLSWAAANPKQVAAWAGIYPVCNLASYPGLERAAPAFSLTPEQLNAQLKQFNPVDRIEGLAKSKVPLFAIHGDVDTVVPLELNSGMLRDRYGNSEGPMELIVPPGQGHNMWEGFFQCQELVDFVFKHAK